MLTLCWLLPSLLHKNKSKKLYSQKCGGATELLVKDGERSENGGEKGSDRLAQINGSEAMTSRVRVEQESWTKLFGTQFAQSSTPCK
jgi:hypothetical protein